MQLVTSSTTYQAEKQNWLYSHDGAKGAKPATLAIALFTKATHFPNGYLPSGLELAVVTQAGPNLGKFGPYDPAASDGRQNSIVYLFTATEVRVETADVIGTVLDGTYTPTIVKSKLPIPTKLTAATEATVGRRFIFEN